MTPDSPLPICCCRPLSNTGQGRRRLNARAALRAAGQDKQPQTGPTATSPVPHPQLQPTPASTLPGSQPSLDATENSSNRKSKAMAGAYSFTYSKMQAQGQLMHPSMQLALAEAAAAGNHGQDLLPSGKLALLGALPCTSQHICSPILSLD